MLVYSIKMTCIQWKQSPKHCFQRKNLFENNIFDHQNDRITWRLYKRNGKMDQSNNKTQNIWFHKIYLLQFEHLKPSMAFQTLKTFFQFIHLYNKTFHSMRYMLSTFCGIAGCVQDVFRTLGGILSNFRSAGLSEKLNCWRQHSANPKFYTIELKLKRETF